MLIDRNSRVTIALIITFAVHAALIAFATNRQKTSSPHLSLQKRVTISLAPRKVKPETPQPVSVAKSAPRNTLPIVEKAIREIPAPRPAAVSPTEIIEAKMPEPLVLDDEIAQPAAEKSAERSEILEKINNEKVPDDDAAAGSALSTVIEARPLYKKNPPPAYPMRARKRRYQGTVKLEVLVSAEGRVNDLKIVTSSGYNILDRAAQKAVKGWLFEPGSRGGQALEMWVRVPVRFVLR